MADDVILIAGNIGSGKSTLLSYIKEQTGVIANAIQQPVKAYHEFIDPVSRKNFYADRRIHTASFERSCLLARIARYQEAKKIPGTIIFDRGMIEGAEIFCHNSYRDGHLSRRGYQSYLDDLYDGLDQLDRTEPHRWLEKLVIFLEVKDEAILHERSKRRAEEKRARGESEEVVPQDYLGAINQHYGKFIRNLEEIYREKYALPVPEVLTINASIDFRKHPNYLSNTFNLINDKIREMKSHAP